MMNSTRPTARNTVRLFLVLFLAFISFDTFAQAGRYDLRLIQESFDCASRKVTFAVQIQASSSENEFILGTSTLPFNFSDTKLTNPVLASANNYSGGRYTTLTLNQQGSVLTLSVIYTGTAPFTDTTNVKNRWNTMARIGFDVPAQSDGCYSLTWNQPNEFLDPQVSQVTISGGTSIQAVATPSAFTGATGCAFAAGLPTATLSGNPTITAGQQAVLTVDFTGSLPVSLGLGGQVFNNIAQNRLSVNVTPTQTTTYTLDSVRNACGRGTVTGSATVTVTAAPPADNIATQNLTASVVCRGTSVPVSFTTNATFNSGNTFKVQLSDASGSNFADIVSAATGTNQTLTATIPANAPAGTGYRLRVVSTNPAIVGTPSAAFRVAEAPTATLSGSTTIASGASANLSVQLTGSAPWTVKLTNGAEYTASSSPLIIPVTPTATTTYALASVQAICSGTVTGSATVTVTAAPPADNIATQNLTARVVCRGSSVPVSFTTNATFNSGNTFKVQLSDASGSNFADIVSAATGTNQTLTATIPANAPAGTGYRLRVVSTNPAIVGTPSAAFRVAEAPTATLSGSTTIASGASANLSVQLTGSAPWTVKLTNGAEYTASSSPLIIPVTPTATTTYALASVQAICSGTVTGSATVTVTTSPADPCDPSACVPISVRIIR